MNKKTTRPVFTVEFKQSAVKLVTDQGYSRQEASNNLGVSLSAITRWVRAELEALGKENNRLKMERDILKKATVYSGLIELDTLIMDNIIHYRGEHEYKTSVQNLYHRI